APSALNSFADALPMPPPAPVINATFPCSRPAMLPPLIERSFRSASRLDGRFDECAEQAVLRDFADLHLRMPLNADAPRMVVGDDGFDHAVVGVADGAHALTQLSHGLVMPGARIDLGLTENA